MKNIHTLLILEKVIHAITDFFYDRNFHEVIVPIFHKALPLEPNIYAIKSGKYYLPTSPEATLKKAIAKGAGNCFAIGHTFRGLEGASPIHRPEFLMLEWYREGVNYEDIMRECEELIKYLVKKLETGNLKLEKVKWSRISMVSLFKEYAKLDLEEIIDDNKMNKIAKDKGYNTKNSTWEQIFNQIFLNEIESHLPKEPFFLTDYPSRISPLCAKRRSKPYLAERFELYINGIEIANGNTENTDAEGILRGMKDEEKYRKKNSIICPPIDMEFINALKYMKKKRYAGIGLGVERLAMLLGGIRNINQLT